jgi:N-dimethylarginine dimethylaminohydrolase
MKLDIKNETNQLFSVILGVANDFGFQPTPENCIDPKTKHFVLNNSFPSERDCIKEVESFNDVLLKYEVEVIRPKNIEGLNQIFTRDVGFVIKNKFFKSNTISERKQEKDGINNCLKKINKSDIVEVPEDIRVEGGDVLVDNDFIFIGTSNVKDTKLKVSRTNEKSVDFIKEVFPNKSVVGLELYKDDNNPFDNILHLDCTMQPIGNGKIIIFKNGIRKDSDKELIKEIYGAENCIEISREEMYEGYSNIFSINSNTIVSDKTFVRLNNKLSNLGFKVEEVYYREVSKFGGLFRCSTLPLYRK